MQRPWATAVLPITWLSSHASQFGLHKKHKLGNPYRPEAFFDKKGYDKAVIDLKKNYDEKLKQG